MDTKYFKNSYCREILDGDYTLIIVHDSGTYLKLRTSIWNNIQYYIENNMKMDERLWDIFHVLLEYGIVFEHNKISFDYDSVMLQLTSGCNLSCTHCCAQMIHAAGMVTMDIVDKVVALNPKTLILTGGEPMTHPQFWKIVQYIKERFHHRLILMTNATLIDEINIDKLCSCFDYFDISLDGIGTEDTSRIRGDGVYERVISAVKLLKKRGQDVGVSVVGESCMEDMNHFYKLADSLGVNPGVRTLNVVDKVIENFNKVVPGGKLSYIESTVRMLYESIPNDVLVRSCGMIRYELFVDVKGNVYPCGGLAEDKFRIGSIEDISNLPDYIMIEQKLLKEEVFAPCRDCKYRAGCWECFNELTNRAKIPEIFLAFCKSSKEKWKSILRNEG